MARWRLLVTTPRGAAENMALDEALLRHAALTGECVWRVYGWQPPALSLGRHQRARGVVREDAARERGIEVVRRLTGGRALLHHREVTYCAVAPLRVAGSLRAWYGHVNTILLDALLQLGVAAVLAPRAGRMPPPASAPCFELPAEGEVTWNGRKLVGSALVRQGGAVLQHGSILVQDDQSLVGDLMRLCVAAPAPAATLAGAMGRDPSLDEVAAALFRAVRRHADADAEPMPGDGELRSLAAAAQPRYVSSDWTWER